jgi:hypothetical protein
VACRPDCGRCRRASSISVASTHDELTSFKARRARCRRPASSRCVCSWTGVPGDCPPATHRPSAPRPHAAAPWSVRRLNGILADSTPSVSASSGR